MPGDNAKKVPGDKAKTPDEGDKAEALQPAENGATAGLERNWVRRLKTFSGRRNPPSSELDFESWEFEVGEILLEASLDDRAKWRLVFGSLAQPAAGLGRSLGQKSGVEKLVMVLKAAYGHSSDWHELLMKFYDTLQKDSEIPSGYLQRLQGLLRRAVDAGAVDPVGEFDTLLKQFHRGCRDEQMLLAFDILSDVDNIDTSLNDFATFFCALKEEEARRQERVVRFTSEAKPDKKKVASKAHSVQEQCPQASSEVTQLTETVKALAIAVEELRKGSVAQPPKPEPRSEGGNYGRGRGRRRSSPSGRNRSNGPRQRRVVCYNCGGTDGHFHSDCTLPPDPAKVCQALKSSNTPGN